MEKNQLKEHFLNLYLMALSDGVFGEEELNVILKIADERGVTRDEFKEFITNPTNTIPIIPDTFLLKVKFLYDLTRVILADGIIDDSETKLFMKFCEKYGFGEEESVELFEWLQSLVKKGVTNEGIDKELELLIG